MSEILQINNLSKSYRHIVAVDNLSLTVKQGEIFGILGPNGSGKTTTLSIILDIIQAEQGSFQWFGESVSINTKKRIGSLIETPNFYPYLTILQNLKITAKIKQIPKTDIDRVLTLVDLLKRKNSPFQTLSLGMKQRLSLAALLLGDPEVLVLDEPTNGLDPEGIAEVRNIILDQAKRGKTIIIASHILDEVEKICTHVAVLKKGKLISNGKVSELLNPEDQLIISSQNIEGLYELMIRSGMCKKITKQIDDLIFTLNKNQTASEINEFAYKNGFVLSKIELRKKSLEAQFLELVK